MLRRRREIGIRVALGARSTDIKWLVLGHGLRLASIGIVAGICLSAVVTQVLRRFLIGVNPLDPVTFVTASMLWILISVLASYLPARRASAIPPLVALRHE
ncbi:MAG: FtsX-like permease family protein [Bryobacteraceae bacterium]